MSGFLLFIAALLGSAALVFGVARGRQRRVHLDTFPYASLLDRRLAAKHPQLTLEQRKLVFTALKDYFHLCREARRRMVSMPSQVVDDAWHEFILFTRQYETFCREAFGRFLHHTPAEAMASPTQAQDGIKRAWRLACRREGIDPRHPARLPLLFAIDSQLGIAHGFHYKLDCMVGRQEGDTSYCGSHIGCGGGCSGDSGGCGGDSGGDGGGGCGGGGD